MDDSEPLEYQAIMKSFHCIDEGSAAALPSKVGSVNGLLSGNKLPRLRQDALTLFKI